ncbi:MAG: LysM peptidoglycan-binding domain-containing protein [Clostridium sp.]|nr:LysM peptidoglycan-binding domain-containing protein [Acetatifactor muris]MCM1526406.1 LysM peptidoglycan-binding domain-containing protein [Bacteroides sp.]MCM1563231.1 LysM peptidoglycan-binding domain-containing protein [Clostridium sp.]
MKNKVFTALLLAAVLALGPVSGSLASSNVSATADGDGITTDDGSAATDGDSTTTDPSDTTDADGEDGEDGGNEEKSLSELVREYGDNLFPEDNNNPTDEEKAAAVAALADILSKASMDDLVALYAEDEGAIMGFEVAYRRAMGIDPVARITDGAVWSEREAGGMTAAQGAIENELADGVTQITLKLESPDPTQTAEPGDAEYQKYTATRLVNISLEGIKDTNNLRFPVRIVLPVPAGLDAGKEITLLHYANGVDQAPTKLNIVRTTDSLTTRDEEGNVIEEEVERFSFILTSLGDNNLFVVAGEEAAAEDVSLGELLYAYADSLFPADAQNPTAEEKAAAEAAMADILAKATISDLAALYAEDDGGPILAFERAYRRAMGIAPTARYTDGSIWATFDGTETNGDLENELAEGTDHVELRLESPDSATGIPGDAEYQKYGAAYMTNISLEGIKDTKNLRFPVRIVLPVPAGLDAGGEIAVLHYANGVDQAPTKLNVVKSKDMIRSRDEEGNDIEIEMDRIKFVVTTLGDCNLFVIAGEAAAVTGDDATEEVVDKLGGLTNLLGVGTVAQADAVVGETLAAAGMEELETVLTDNETVIGDLEKAYLDQKGLEETAVSAGSSVLPASSEDKISVVGAGLNELKEGETKATLKVEDTEEKPAETAQYAKAVSLDITLEGVKDTKNLRCPVKITLPVPSGLDAAKVLVVLHYASGPDQAPIKLSVTQNSDGTISFCVSSFSVFVIAEDTPAGDDGNNGNDDNTGDVSGDNGNDGNGGNDNDGNDDTDNAGGSADDNDDDNAGGSAGYVNVDVEDQILSAAKNATVRLNGITTLSNGMMKSLLERKDVTLVMEYTYENKNYTVVIPAGAAMNNDIQWYGPLYLVAHYGSRGVSAANVADGAIYMVQAGDTMTKIAKMHHMTLAQLAAKNPQIKNINLIRVGQRINLK